MDRAQMKCHLQMLSELLSSQELVDAFYPQLEPNLAVMVQFLEKSYGKWYELIEGQMEQLGVERD